MADPRLFKIFLSSPGDVPTERDAAEAVIRAIDDSGEFRNHFILRLYRWDDTSVVLPMPATDIPQRSVDQYMIRPSACDLVVCIFWSRMGSPLVMDGREYLSGTYYEYAEALDGYARDGKPAVWVYRCAEEPQIGMRDPHRDEKNAQFDRVDAFFAGFTDESGRLKRGINTYLTHADFGPLFEQQLRTYLRHLRDRATTPPPPPPLPARWHGAPYKGLLALREDDAPIFFGRERETLDVRNRLKHQGFVIITGASGSGKSSLAGAGVSARLRAQGWQTVRFFPQDRPFFNLALALLTGIRGLGVAPLDAPDAAAALAERLRADPAHLDVLLAAHGPERILLVVDQLEELFTLAPPDEARAFAELLNGCRLTRLATMRADFFERAIPYFAAALRQNYPLDRPSPFALMEMVVRPAELAGIAWEAGLDERILNDAGDEPGALALVAFVLQALYEHNPRAFRRADYEAIGGVEDALKARAEATYAEMKLPHDSPLLGRVFRELVEVDARGTATRQRCAMARFDADALALIQAFADARLLVIDEENKVEVAHDALFRSWPRLRAWIAEAQEDLILLRQARNAAQDWAAKRAREPEKDFDYLRWPHERLELVDAMRKRIDPTFDADEGATFKAFIEPEATRLLRKLEMLPHDATSHELRCDIGDRLAVIDDPRPGVGLDVRGLPHILWLPVEESNDEVTLKTDEREIGPVTIPRFYVAKYLVTYAQYLTFVNASDGFDNPGWWVDMPEQYRHQKLIPQRTKRKNAPRASVSWYQAVAFASWLNAKYHEYNQFTAFTEGEWEIRLPTEWEWQWMAQGGAQELKYPWGADWREGYANTSEAGLSRTTAVGMYPAGAAACGALDVAGNLYEWCMDNYEYTNNQKVLRGGSFDDNDDEYTAVATKPYGSDPHVSSRDFGFRLVVSAPMRPSDLRK